MTYEYRTGDIFESGADAIVIPVNTVGVLGVGLARQFRDREPSLAAAWRSLCQTEPQQPGTINAAIGSPKDVYLLVTTKAHWRGPSKLEWVARIIEALATDVTLKAGQTHATVAVPPLGCGHGGLDWEDVRPLMEEAFKDTVVTFLIYGEAP